MAFEDAIVTPLTFVFPALMSVRRNKIGILAVHFSSFCFCFSSRFEEHIIGKLSKLTQLTDVLLNADLAKKRILRTIVACLAWSGFGHWIRRRMKLSIHGPTFVGHFY